ncbi:unnamed protein product [Notodromas monacha]|uniref:Tectonin beta-propeller repeat-containing protein 2 n=1 Tax=Notodromas monacha TaxID=399045 RepID=A0A7R9BGR4_9CRUS|nr:unnamed protein product [Notodromas monacha]CAG0915181.1 unnamed protein product [Notodromas monacha]
MTNRPEIVTVHGFREVSLQWLSKQIPKKVYQGSELFNLFLNCISFRDESLAIGTSVGLVYFFSWSNNEMHKLRCEDRISPISAVALESTVDFMVASGSSKGNVTIFQIPKFRKVGDPRPKTEIFNIQGFHNVAITALKWSSNGEYLFSGDANGAVLQTRIHFDAELLGEEDLIDEDAKRETEKQLEHCTWFDVDEGKLVSWNRYWFHILGLSIPAVFESVQIPYGIDDLSSDGGKIVVLTGNQIRLFSSSLSGIASGCCAENQKFVVIETDSTGFSSWGLHLVRTKLEKLVLATEKVIDLDEFVDRSSKKLFNWAESSLIRNETASARVPERYDIGVLGLNPSGDSVLSKEKTEVEESDQEDELSVQRVIRNGDRRRKKPKQNQESENSNDPREQCEETLVGNNSDCQETDVFPVFSGNFAESDIAVKEDLLGKLIDVNFGAPFEEDVVEPEVVSGELRSSSPDLDRRSFRLPDVEIESDVEDSCEFTYGPPSRDDSSIASRAASIPDEPLILDQESVREQLAEVPGIGTDWAEFPGPGSRVVSSIALDRTQGVGWLCFDSGAILVQKDLTPSVPFSRSIKIGGVPTKDGDTSVVVSIKANDGIVWALCTRGELWVRIGVSRERPMGLEWAPAGEKIPGPVLAFDFGPQRTAFAANANGALFFTQGICRQHPAGDDVWWEVSVVGALLPGASSSKFASLLFPDARAGVRDRGTSFPGAKWLPSQRAAIFTSLPHMPVVAASNQKVWLAWGASSNIHCSKNSISGHRVIPIEIRGLQSVRWKVLEAGSVYKKHGVLWLLSQSGDKVFTYQAFGSSKSRPNHIPLPEDEELVLQLTSGPESLWMLTSSRKIYIRAGISASCPEGHSWSRLDLSQIGNDILTSISISSEVVWGVDFRGGVWMRIGSLKPTTTANLPPAWVPVEEGSAPAPMSQFKEIFLGPRNDMVWAIDSKHRVYVRAAVLPDLPIGVNWVPVLGVDAVHISISETTVWALSLTGEVWRRFGISSNNFAGDYWKKIPCGSAAYISVSIDDKLWVVDTAGAIHLHRLLNYSLTDSGEAAEFTVLAEGEVERTEDVDGDWLLVS